MDQSNAPGSESDSDIEFLPGPPKLSLEQHIDREVQK